MIDGQGTETMHDSTATNIAMINDHPNDKGCESRMMSLLTVRHRCPGWARGGTVEANLVGFNRFDFLELLILVLGGNADFALSCGGEGSIVSQISGGLV
jgi:hypothetical protein